MSTALEPCPSCRRHVRAASACPFCDAPIDARATVARVAIVVAIGAGVAAAACAGSPGPANVYGGPPRDLERDAAAAPSSEAPSSADPAKPPVDPSPTAPTSPTRVPAPMYGAPPPPELP